MSRLRRSHRSTISCSVNSVKSGRFYEHHLTISSVNVVTAAIAFTKRFRSVHAVRLPKSLVTRSNEFQFVEVHIFAVSTTLSGYRIRVLKNQVTGRLSIYKIFRQKIPITSTGRVRSYSVSRRAAALKRDQERLSITHKYPCVLLPRSDKYMSASRRGVRRRAVREVDGATRDAATRGGRQ